MKHSMHKKYVDVEIRDRANHARAWEDFILRTSTEPAEVTTEPVDEVSAHYVRTQLDDPINDQIVTLSATGVQDVMTDLQVALDSISPIEWRSDGRPYIDNVDVGSDFSLNWNTATSIDEPRIKELETEVSDLKERLNRLEMLLLEN